VGRGASDVSGNSSSVCQNNKGVCTDQGPSAFDLDTPPSFPTFDGPPNPDECALSTWRACIAQSATRPGQGLRVERVAGLPVISFPVGAVVSNLTGCVAALTLTTETLTLNTQSFDCTYTLNGMRGGFKYTGNTNPATLEVYGSINLKGFNLTLSKHTDYVARTYKLESNGTVTMKNNASLVIERSSSSSTATGNMNLNGNLLPSITGGNPYFPDHVLGLVAEGDVYQRGDYIMSPLYSGGTFRIVKDSVLFGSVVTNMFCTTSAGSQDSCNAGQKAEVVYVNTGNNKPSIMKQIEKSGIPTFKVLSYERR
jgi:hypothetical protein